MTRRSSLVLAILALAFGVGLFAADVTGSWKADFDTPVGHRNYTYDLKADGEKLTGKATSERGEAELSEGKVSGDEIFFVEPLEIQGQSIRIEYTGKVSGDEIQFKRQVGDFGSQEFVAKRAK
jgi:hypothetical protein